MADPKITGPLPPVEWDLPDAASDNSPDKSFNDDHIAARLKLDEAARQRIATDRFALDAPRDLLARHEKVEEAASFLPPNHDHDQARRARRYDESQGDAASRRPTSPTERPNRGPGDPSDVERRVENLLTDLQTLSGQLDAATRAETQRTQLEARLLKLELQAKHNLQQLLAGGVGFTMLGDVRLTFKKLFDRIRKWPRRVRPGHRPETDAEFDAFLAWVFEPPAAPSDDTERLSAFER